MLASALSPLGAIYGRMAERKMAGVAPYRSRLPVICIGNFTAGGGGKTPTAIAVAKVLKEAGERPSFLTRGYGGKTQGPVLVAKGQSAAEVGDETLLLAAHAPTVVSADRAAGARLIEGTDATVIVMDDGFQNPQLAKDFSLIVVDAATGLGNGLVMPAGPLRAPLDKQMPRADALLLIGDGGKTAPLAKSFEAANKPVLKARMAPRGDARWLGVLPVIGFAGIANPKKFYATLSQNGARLTGTRSFPDHHPYTERQAERLLRWAREWNAMLVTTEKDWVRLPDDDGTELLRAQVPLAAAPHRHRVRRRQQAEAASGRDDREAPRRLNQPLVMAGHDEIFTCLRRRVGVAEALQRSCGVDIGLLQLDAPIAQLLERNGASGDGAAHEVARRHHLHLAVEIFELGFALEANVAFETVHQGCASPQFEFRRFTIASASAEASPLTTMCPAFRRGRAHASGSVLPCGRHHLPAQGHGHRRTRCPDARHDARRRRGEASAPRRRG